MTGQGDGGEGRKGSRFVFVSRVRYLLRSDQTGEDREGLASNVSLGGLCLTAKHPLAVEQEIRITECILPYCRKVYKVQWVEEDGSGTYRAGLVGIDESAPEAGRR